MKDHPEAIEDGTVENLPYEHMATAFTGTAVQRLTEQGIELFGGMGVVQGMPIEKYVRDAIDPETHLVSVPDALQDHRSAGGLQATRSAFRRRELVTRNFRTGSDLLVSGWPAKQASDANVTIESSVTGH